jgi:hypothetical protein
MKTHLPDPFFAEPPEAVPTGRASRSLLSYNDALAVPASALAAVPGDARYAPVATAMTLIAQTMEHDVDFPRIFFRRGHTAMSLAGSSYVQQLLVLAMAGLPLPGPLELAQRYGLTKQAVSREVLDAIARIKEEDPRLAEMLEAARATYHSDDPAGARAPHPRERDYAVPISACDGRTVIEVDFSDGKKRARISRDKPADCLIFKLEGTDEERRAPYASTRMIWEETDRGTVVAAPFVRVAA